MNNYNKNEGYRRQFNPHQVPGVFRIYPPMEICRKIKFLSEKNNENYTRTIIRILIEYFDSKPDIRPYGQNDSESL
jgi:hypothetical protein